MKILFAGTPKVAASVLASLAKQHEICLVITRPDAEIGRKHKLTPSEVAVVAEGLGVPTLKADHLGALEIELIRQSGAERAVVVAYGSMIPKSALDLFPWWNLHFSLLPLWRGASPLQHSLISRIGQGITLFELEESLDTGPVVEDVPLNLPDDQPAEQIMEHLGELGSQLIIRNLENAKLPRDQQGQATYAPKISRADARISFEETAPEIQRRVYAFNPEPMAWCRAGERDLRILRARAIGAVDWNSVSEKILSPGEIEVSAGKVLVGCGHGSRLELIEVQPAGGKQMQAMDWLRGFGGAKLE